MGMTFSDDTASRLVQPVPSLRFTLRQVECFLAVAQSGSISRAAESLHASESTVADAISAMERSLATELFRRRRSRGASLTSDGLAILPLARRILADGAELTAAVGRDVSSIAGPVRIGCLNTLASHVLPRLILEVEKRFPGIDIEYQIDDFASTMQETGTAELDLVVAFDNVVPPEFDSMTIATTEPMVVVSADHSLADRDQVQLSELEDEPMVLFDVLSSRFHAMEVMSAQGLRPRIAHRTSDYELCRALVGRGLGYSLLMRREISASTWDGQQVAYLYIEPRPRPVEALLAWPPGVVPPRVKAVVECMEIIRDEIAQDMLQTGYSTG